MIFRLRLSGSLAALLVAGIVFSGVAAALDINDVKNLVRSRVGEEVIVTMIGQSTPIAMSDGDAEELRALGASETLVAVVRNSSNQAQYAAPASGYSQGYDGEYVMSDGSTTPVQAGSAGTVTYVDPSTGVTYVEPGAVYSAPPTVVYESAPTVVYEAAPTYVYPYPTYRSGPSFSIGIGVGGGRRGYHGGRGHRRR